MASIVGRLVQGWLGDGPRLAGELREVILRQIAGLDGALAEVTGQAAGLLFVDAIEPGHVTLFLVSSPNGGIGGPVPALALKGDKTISNP